MVYRGTLQVDDVGVDEIFISIDSDSDASTGEAAATSNWSVDIYGSRVQERAHSHRQVIPWVLTWDRAMVKTRSR